jgi:hypothetical protein
MKSNREVIRDLDTMRDILAPLDDDGREGMLATMICWFLAHYPDRQTALADLLERTNEIEREVEGEVLQ